MISKPASRAGDGTRARDFTSGTIVPKNQEQGGELLKPGATRRGSRRGGPMPPRARSISSWLVKNEFTH